MANNYLQFALSFPLKTRAEQQWCETTMNALTDLLECSAEDPEEKLQLAKELGDLGHVVMSEGYDFIDFEWSCSATEMHIYAEESGTPELVAAFLQQYLEKFQLHSPPAGTRRVFHVSLVTSALTIERNEPELVS